MTLGKHKIRGVTLDGIKPLAANIMESRLHSAGYVRTGSAPAEGGRWKLWFNHPTYGIVEAIYSPDKLMVITAYHSNEED